MIFSILIRNFKVYRGWNYIPISNLNNLSSLVGENGVGKSSILEAINIFFENLASEWNVNHSIQKSGYEGREPVICPIFIIEKNKINKNRNIYKYFELVSNITWQLEKDDFNSSHHKVAEKILEQIKTIKEKNIQVDNTHFLIPCGMKKTDQRKQIFSIGLLEGVSGYKDDLRSEFSINLDEFLEEAFSYIKESIEYIHIPSEVDYETYTKLEGKTAQSLMGTSVDNIIKDFIDEKVIKNINTGLDDYLSKIGGKLEKYEYKKPSQRQTIFNLSHLTSKVIETYFDSKILNLKSGTETTPIYHCSSGEKRKALIDIAQAFILNSNRDFASKTVILAIDEPEASLHISSCFEQFEKLERISKSNVQVIISTHWYGFFPSISSGNATYISDINDEKHSFMISLDRFREDIKAINRNTAGAMPNSVELKTVNDLVQSVISSISKSDTNWIICEGASDKIYLNHFFKKEENVKIISAGGSKYVKKIFEYMYLVLDEVRQDLKGKIFFLIDTDRKFESYTAKESIKNIAFKRVQNCTSHKKTILLKTSDNKYYPPTEIEDVLNSNVFYQTLEYLHKNEPSGELSLLIDSIDIFSEDLPSGLAFNLRSNEQELLWEFFDKPKIKVKFAEEYCKLDSTVTTPSWADEIKYFFKGKQTK
ncbi:MAG: ATP-binding protein [Gammaproteobacteria bacterium]|nr:ATP-binding protein [Gammaproteobacteria bacterium]